MRLRARLLGWRLALQASAHRRGQLLAYVQRWRMRSKHKAGKQRNAHQPPRWTKTNKREQRRARTGEQRAVAPGQVVRPLLVARLQVDLRAAASSNPQGNPLSKSDLSGNTSSCFCTFAPPASPTHLLREVQLISHGVILASRADRPNCRVYIASTSAPRVGVGVSARVAVRHRA